MGVFSAVYIFSQKMNVTPQNIRLPHTFSLFQKLFKILLTISTPFDIIIKLGADIAQLAEHVIGNDEVMSSNLIISSKKGLLTQSFFHTIWKI